MLHSKATAALMRLKEMDRKYNIKRNEDKRGRGYVSSETSLEGTPRDRWDDPRSSSDDKPEVVPTFDDAESDGRSKVSTKSKIHITVPSLCTKDDNPSISKSSSKKKSTQESPKNSLKSLEEDTDVSVHEGSVSISKESSRVSSLNRTTTKFKTRNEMNTAGSVIRKITAKSSEDTILSEASAASEIISEMIKSAEESLTVKSDGKVNVLKERISVHEPEADGDEGTIDEVIRISAEGSEIVSEIVNRSRGVPNASSREEQRVQYESDTFEEASISTASSSFTEQRSKKTFQEEIREDTVRSGVKQIMITPHKQIRCSQKITVDERDKKIVELVPPKIVQSTSECDIGLDEELSNYVKTTENVDELAPISLLKLSKQTTPVKKQRRNKRHRKSNENTEGSQERTESSETSDHERLTRNKENKNEDHRPSENIFTTRTVDQRKEAEGLKESDENPLEEIENGIEDTEAQNQAENEEAESIPSEKLLRETPKTSDVTWRLRKLNRDAIDAIAGRYRIRRPKETQNKSKSKQCRKCGTVVKLPSAEYEASDRDDSRTGSYENLGDTNQDHRKKRNKPKRSSKSSKARKSSNRSKIEEKQSRFDCRQAHRIRKQAAALRLQQEREDIRNYLLEMEHTRLEYGIGDLATNSKLAPFKPLEFPKIAAFVKLDSTNVNLKPNDEVATIQERIVSIRQWLKDQYVLYRDYSSLAQTMNVKYIPASLEDAKRTIRQLQKATIKAR
ncbi:PREDICTED: uncharacterized protein LOC107186953 [Dufourea novaeangliae]|uniref:uncharacterized protein LOC107186953 n=1 Tax=Dufourea novaeangliae TaxID=178035 RepID=UPI0007675664|nr:PREDICTED: uncharacterized protein LOC107186953 [Dufourea novaeangliae]